MARFTGKTSARAASCQDWPFSMAVTSCVLATWRSVFSSFIIACTCPLINVFRERDPEEPTTEGREHTPLAELSRPQEHGVDPAKQWNDPQRACHNPEGSTPSIYVRGSSAIHLHVLSDHPPNM